MLETLRLLRAPSRRGRAALEAHQSARLRRLFANAYARVPHYRRLFDAHGVAPRHIRGVGDLHLIPITTRRDLQTAKVEELVAKGIDPERLIVNSTSGSTGEPLRIRRTWFEQNLLHLYRLRALRDVGVRRNDRLMRVANVRPVHARDSKLLGQVLMTIGLQQKRLAVDVRGSPDGIAAEYRRLRPHVLSASPSILLLLAEAFVRADPGFHPRVIISGGEVLTPEHRALIEEELGAPVRDVYSSLEMGVLAWECAATGAMHTMDDSTIVEVLVDGRPAEPGEAGDVVVTNLHAFAAPFLRYRQGDVATRGPTPCACGAAFATITGLEGRRLDFLPLPDGRVLHPYRLIGSILAQGGWVRQYQITQERMDRIVLRVVPEGTPSPELLEQVGRSLGEVLGSGVELEVVLVAHIPLEPGGKFRVARSLVASTAAGGAPATGGVGEALA